jgi:hypothetical protein
LNGGQACVKLLGVEILWHQNFQQQENKSKQSFQVALSTLFEFISKHSFQKLSVAISGCELLLASMILYSLRFFMPLVENKLWPWLVHSQNTSAA